MFGIFKKKPLEIKSPVNGKVVTLDSVPDEVFATKLAGDGVAVIPQDGTFKAPIDGIVSKIFDTNHAYIITSDSGIEVMVHIGLETVALNGKGFTRIASEGDSVKVGDVIIEADLDYIKEHAKDTITPIIISDESEFKEILKEYNVVKTSDKIMEVN